MISLFKKKKIGMCNICEKTFPENKLEEVNDLWLCSKDLKIYNKSKWVLFKKATSDPENPVNGIELYELAQKLKDYSIPSYIKSEYQEDIEFKKIFTTISLFCRDEDLEKINKKQLN